MYNSKLIKKKFQKLKKRKLKKFEFKTNCLKFGSIGIKAVESGIINYKQIESFKNIIFKKTYKKIKIWIRVLPNFYVTKKQTGLRMGKGKGKLLNMVCRVINGTIIFEISGLKTQVIINIIKLSKLKLPIKTKIFK